MRKLIAFLILAAPLSAAYSPIGTITFAGAVGSNQSNITLAFSFSDPRLADVAHGGQMILVSRNGSNVPAGMALSTDSSCATIAGVNGWGFDGDYSNVSGSGHGHVNVQSLTTSGLTLTICMDPSLSTYQGGAAGSEFPASLLGAWHLADGSSLSSVDFGPNGCNGIAASVTATTGQIDGGASFTSTSSKDLLGGTTCGSAGSGTSGVLDSLTFTYEAWINTASTSGDIYTGGHSALPQFRLVSGKLSLDNANTANVATSTGTVSTGSFHHVAVTWDGATGAYAFYIDGSAAGSGTATVPGAWTAVNWRFTNHTWQLGYFNGAPNMTIDEPRVHGAVLSANYIASEVGNQASVPAAVFTSANRPNFQPFLF